MLYTLVKSISYVVCHLPETLRRFLSKGLGVLCWLVVSPKRRAMAVRNIQLSLDVSEQQAVDIAKQSTTRFGTMIMEVLSFPLIKRNVSGYVEFSGQEHLEQALSYGRGVVLATAHSGNWELLGAALALNGYPIVGVAQKQTNEQMDRFINEYRVLVGMRVTYKSGVREMVRMLGSGNIIGLLMDQNAGRDGTLVTFFNRLASTPQGPAFLAHLKNAPIVPAFITQQANGKHRVYIHKPIFTAQTDDRQQDIHNATQVLTTIIEQHIRQHPAEWFWLHNRWKYAEKTIRHMAEEKKEDDST